MASSDFEFMTLRNLTAYQPDGTRVMPNYMLLTSTNGGAFFTDSITISSIHTSSFTASSISANLITASTLNANTVLSNSTITNVVASSTIYTSSIFPGVIYDNTNSGGALAQILTAGAGNTLLWVDPSGIADVEYVSSGRNISVDNTNYQIPIINLNSSIILSTIVTSTISSLTILDKSGAIGLSNQVLKADGTGKFSWATDTAGGIVDSVVGGNNITIDSTIVANPIVNLNSSIIVSTIVTSTISSLTILDKSGAIGLSNQVLKADGTGKFSWATDTAGGIVDAIIGGNNITINSTVNVAFPIVNLNSSIILSTIITSTISSLTILDKNGGVGGTNQILTADGLGKFSWATNSSGIPNGINWGDYIYWTGGSWAIAGTSTIRLGLNSGISGQSPNSVAVGPLSGRSNQGVDTVSVGNSAGEINQSDSGVALGVLAGQQNQKEYSIAIGRQAGQINQSTNSIAIGYAAGQANQVWSAIAIGENCGNNAQGGRAIAIGQRAGRQNQGFDAIAIGSAAAEINQEGQSIAIGLAAGGNSQRKGTIALGFLAGADNQSTNAIAIGREAGRQSQGQNSIAIGYLAGYYQSANTIVLNASSTFVNASTFSDAFYVKPIRNTTDTGNVIQYNTVTSEVTYVSKSFVIDHPKNPERYLVHACLEGPEDGIYYRGHGEITSHSNSTIVTLPDYVDSLGTDFTVQITPIFNGTVLSYAASEITNGSFTVHGQPGRFFWLVHGKRSTFNIEPLKASAHLVGNGPYKWLEYTKNV
jgi:hypothetical protein